MTKKPATPKTKVSDRQQLRLYELADEMAAFRRIVKLHFDYESAADFEALALITRALITRMQAEVKDIANALDCVTTKAAKAA
jgi:hypothetical protein